jgi:hypothetical protein
MRQAKGEQITISIISFLFLIGVAAILWQQSSHEDAMGQIKRDNKMLALSNLKNNKMIDKIIEQFPDEEFLIADGFDEAVIGVDTISMRLIYSVSRCISILCLDEDMDVDDAIEHFEYNVRGSYVGEKTPIWCDELNF